MSDPAVRRLLDLLAEEALAIGRADLSTLGELAERKQALAGELSVIRDAEGLQAVRAALARNERLFKAAIEGVEAARERLTEVAGVKDRLATYDEAGQVNEVFTKKPEHQRRA